MPALKFAHLVFHTRPPVGTDNGERPIKSPIAATQDSGKMRTNALNFIFDLPLPSYLLYTVQGFAPAGLIPGWQHNWLNRLTLSIYRTT